MHPDVYDEMLNRLNVKRGRIASTLEQLIEAASPATEQTARDRPREEIHPIANAETPLKGRTGYVPSEAGSPPLDDRELHTCEDLAQQDSDSTSPVRVPQVQRVGQKRVRR